MGREARQRDTRERKRIDPVVGDRRSSRHGLHERAVEGCIVRKDEVSSDELGKARHGIGGRRRIGHIGLMDAGQGHDFGRDQAFGPHEGMVAVDNLLAREAGTGNLQELAVLEGKTGGLGIEHHQVFLKRSEILFLCALGKGQIVLPDARRRVRQKQAFERDRRIVGTRHQRSSSAHSTKRVQSSENGMPAARAASGRRLLSVMPGIVLISSRTGMPSF